MTGCTSAAPLPLQLPPPSATNGTCRSGCSGGWARLGSTAVTSCAWAGPAITAAALPKVSSSSAAMAAPTAARGMDAMIRCSKLLVCTALPVSNVVRSTSTSDAGCSVGGGGPGAEGYSIASFISFISVTAVAPTRLEVRPMAKVRVSHERWSWRTRAPATTCARALSSLRKNYGAGWEGCDVDSRSER